MTQEEDLVTTALYSMLIVYDHGIEYAHFAEYDQALMHFKEALRLYQKASDTVKATELGQYWLGEIQQEITRCEVALRPVTIGELLGE